MRRLLTEGMNAVYLKNLDEKDNQIIALLLENARLTYSEIGEQIGLSRVAVKNRVKLMSTEQSKKPCGARHSGPFVV